MDICAFLAEDAAVPLLGRVKIPAGLRACSKSGFLWSIGRKNPQFEQALRLEIPPGFEAQIRPRSGPAIRSGFTAPNSPGAIDADFLGEAEIILVNLKTEPASIKNGDRIAQMVISPVMQAFIKETASLSETKRESGGFGSTGM
jgi:deoxyuridine 5'-triphosphate nucleotidohydrolase